jgi:hypothetical protein
VVLAGIPIFYFINKLLLAFYFGHASWKYAEYEPQDNPWLILVEILFLFFLLWLSKLRWEPLPLDEVQFVPPEDLEKVNRQAVPKYWYVLGVLVIVHAIFGLYFNPLLPARDQPPLLETGFLFSQPFLLAMWAALAPQHFYQRFLWTFLLCTLISFILDLQLLLQGGRGTGTIMILDLTIFIIVTLILLLIRRFSGWQIKRAQLENNYSEYQAYQFGIKHLIILTTITALALGLFRCLLVMYPNLVLPPVANFISGVGLISAMLLPIIIIPWFTMSYGRNMLFLVFFTIILLGAIDIGVYLTIKNVIPPTPNHGWIETILLFQLGTCLSVCISTLVIRLCGFRLIRQRKRA